MDRCVCVPDVIYLLWMDLRYIGLTASMSYCLSELSVLSFLMKYFTVFSCVNQIIAILGHVDVDGMIRFAP